MATAKRTKASSRARRPNRMAKKPGVTMHSRILKCGGKLKKK